MKYLMAKGNLLDLRNRAIKPGDKSKEYCYEVSQLYVALSEYIEEQAKEFDKVMNTLQKSETAMSHVLCLDYCGRDSTTIRGMVKGAVDDVNLILDKYRN